MVESAEEKRGKELMAQAEAALNKWSWFSSSSKYDDANDLYAKAANNFKIAKNWEMAGTCFLKCSEMCLQTNSQYEAASNYVLAAEMMQRVDPGKAVEYYRKAIALLSELGRFGTAAKHCETIADLYEKDNNIQEALTYFQQAADYYSGENSHARAGKCLEKVAMHAATLGDYKKGMEGFEKLGTDSLENNLLKFNAKKHFLHAGFCALARNDIVAAKNAVNRYSELDYTFKASSECKLLENLVVACEEFDTDKFSDVLYSFDSVRPLDPWETSILLRVKKLISTGDDLGAGAGEDDLR